MLTCTVPNTAFLNFDHMQACKLLLPVSNANTVQIVMVGCGGTGSWLAPHLARLASLLGENGLVVDLRFVDPDVVEEVNCYRQNFCPAEIGQNKGLALASRYGAAWGVPIGAVLARFDKAVMKYNNYQDLRIVVGCVDNAAARRKISKVVTDEGAWWLDCGNHHDAGQVLLGSGKSKPSKDPYQLPGYCAWLPMPSEQHPELLEDVVEPELPAVMSCAQAAMAGAQGLTINATVAALAADMLYRLLITKDLDRYAMYVDLAAGSMRSKYIVRDGANNENE